MELSEGFWKGGEGEAEGSFYRHRASSRCRAGGGVKPPETNARDKRDRDEFEFQIQTESVRER